MPLTSAVKCSMAQQSTVSYSSVHAIIKCRS